LRRISKSKPKTKQDAKAKEERLENLVGGINALWNKADSAGNSGAITKFEEKRIKKKLDDIEKITFKRIKQSRESKKRTRKGHKKD